MLAACTIVSKNYLPFARVLARSFLDLHSESRFFVLIVDRIDAHFDPQEESFEIIEVESLDNIPELRSYLFKYNQLECNTAVKPYFLEHLLEYEDLDNLIYFDPDILILNRLSPLEKRLAEVSIVLTPHLTAPLDDGMFPDELAILRAGTYNLGFIALQGTSLTRRFLTWWQERVYDQCIDRVDQGLFVDQKWIDLVPGLFPDVAVLTDPGYNVAYWNLADRRIVLDGGPTANGEPLYFFHFSGIQPEALDRVSKHQDRLVLDDLGQGADLYRRYRDLLMEAGYTETIRWPYAYARFDNEEQIPNLARALYLSLGKKRRRFGDPFATGKRSYFEWIQSPVDRSVSEPPYLSRLLQYLYDRRPDLHRFFPDPSQGHLAGFAQWMIESGQQQHGLSPIFLAALAGTPPSPPPPSRRSLRQRVEPLLRRAKQSRFGQWLKPMVKRGLGAERTSHLREKVRPAPVPEIAIGGQLRLIPAIERPGINVIGYLEAETGMGEGARSIVRALETTDLPVSPHSLSLNVVSRSEDDSIGPAKSDFPWDVNLFFVNADQVDPVYEHLGADKFNGRYNIGFWLWELAEFPLHLQTSFRRFHEIWTPSTFCVEALSAVSPVPVRRVPLPVEPATETPFGRDHFGLAEETFIFLFVFDFLSYVERKNPEALVRAFRKAFDRSADATLVLKASHTDFDPAARARLEATFGDARIHWIPEEVSRAEITALMSLCDCYVSLHRSEGYGLTLAEAMYFKKPVIATAYSGSTDFLRAGTGLPVRYDLVEIDTAVGPYPAGALWAEPDVEHASALMRKVYENRDEARRLATAAGAEIRRHYSTRAVGKLLEKRFAQILRLAHPGRVERSG